MRVLVRIGAAAPAATTGWLAALLWLCPGAGCDAPAAPSPSPSPEPVNALEDYAPGAAPLLEVNSRLLRRFAPLRTVIAADPGTITEPITTLGRTLFFDPRLSKDQDLSCNSCHKLASYGVDNKRFSPGHRGQLTARNTPSVFNAAAYTYQFWDARAEKVEDQIRGPLFSPREMAMTDEASVTAVVRSIPGYRTLFQRAFPAQLDPITFVNITTALGAFERRLTTPGRWDRYLMGDKSALTHEEKAGLRTFTSLGCMVCHTGEVLGAGMLEKVGVVKSWPNQSDQGRYELTKAPADRMMFKVPTLRNVAETAPYFHDGSAEDLPTAVRLMASHQLGIDASPGETAAVVSWLKALTGPLPEDYIVRPALPASGPKTPAPVPY
ncbi:MAG TPA: cytochrome c peroxidase [Polyangia bacterium]|jgi:cytochrome c peroxidase|nr:cytochrome c peroxidase [Polyangia bacterium]